MGAAPREGEERSPCRAEFTGTGGTEDLGKDEIVLEAEDAVQRLGGGAAAVGGCDLRGTFWQWPQGVLVPPTALP